jgi:hypothetical protein
MMRLRAAGFLVALASFALTGCPRPAVLHPLDSTEQRHSFVSVGPVPRVYRLDWLALMPQGYERWGTENPNFDYYLVQFTAGGHHLSGPIGDRTFQVQFGIEIDGGTVAWQPDPTWLRSTEGDGLLGFPTVVAAFPRSEVREIARVSLSGSASIGLNARADLGLNAGAGECVEKNDKNECVRRALYVVEGVNLAVGGVGQIETTAAVTFKKEWSVQEPVMTQTGIGTGGASWVDRSGLFNGDSTYSVVLRVPSQHSNAAQLAMSQEELAKLSASAAAYFTSLHIEPVHQLTSQIAKACMRDRGNIDALADTTDRYDAIVNAMLIIGSRDQKNSATASGVANARLASATSAYEGASKALIELTASRDKLAAEVAAKKEAGASEKDPAKLATLKTELDKLTADLEKAKKEISDRDKVLDARAKDLERIRAAAAYENDFPYASMGLVQGGDDNLLPLKLVKNLLPQETAHALGIADLDHFVAEFDYEFPDEKRKVKFARYEALYEHLRGEGRRAYREIHEAVAASCVATGETVRMYRQLLAILSRQNENLERRIKVESGEAEKSTAVNRGLADSYAKISALQGYRDLLADRLTKFSSFPIERLRLRVAAHKHKPQEGAGGWSWWPRDGDQFPSDSAFEKGLPLFGKERRIDGAITLAKPTPAAVPPKLPLRLFVSSNSAAARVAFIPVDDKGVATGEPRFVSGLTGSAELGAGTWKVTAYPVVGPDGKTLQYPTVVMPDGKKETLSEAKVLRGLELKLDASEAQRQATLEVFFTQPEPPPPTAKEKQ